MGRLVTQGSAGKSRRPQGYKRPAAWPRIPRQSAGLLRPPEKLGEVRSPSLCQPLLLPQRCAFPPSHSPRQREPATARRELAGVQCPSPTWALRL